MEYTIFFFLIAFIVILFVALFIYRKRLRAALHKHYFGKFSFKYLNSLPENILAMQYPSAVVYDPWYVIQEFLNSKINSRYKTEENITFTGYKIGETYPAFFKITGKPYYISIPKDSKDEIKIVVYGYKEQMYDYEVILLYYFWNNAFVAGQYQFKREKQKIDSKDIADKLLAKYNIENVKLNGSGFIIQDKEGNEVCFNDTGFSVDVSFYNHEYTWKLQSTEFATTEPVKGETSVAPAIF